VVNETGVLAPIESKSVNSAGRGTTGLPEEDGSVEEDDDPDIWLRGDRPPVRVGIAFAISC